MCCPILGQKLPIKQISVSKTHLRSVSKRTTSLLLCFFTNCMAKFTHSFQIISYQKELTWMTKKPTVNASWRSDYCLVWCVKKHWSNCSKTNTGKIYNEYMKMSLFGFKWNCYTNLAIEKSNGNEFEKLLSSRGDGLKFKNFENIYSRCQIIRNDAVSRFFL